MSRQVRSSENNGMEKPMETTRNTICWGNSLIVLWFRKKVSLASLGRSWENGVGNPEHDSRLLTDSSNFLDLMRVIFRIELKCLPFWELHRENSHSKQANINGSCRDIVVTFAHLPEQRAEFDARSDKCGFS